MIWQELKYWSIVRGGNEARVSVVDERGDEYYALIDADGGKAYRERRALALDILEEALAHGELPGEVEIRDKGVCGCRVRPR